ncbi:hypothetical protein N802_06335 [Knoellia sinensis KCTC 19936]|uniref:DSBA-like thioredoxin domain-containing protein n=1 Tax=Knoellia sinensis KCTC 19936 TaxID=1385520 RepID=A0A0A0J1S8_9MICO|nr:DsbA family protein [Knoellia sinensis]KGN30669.1 hypothetical protein N802_06335 [Knoellia sinensis KCTC 19936]
MATLDCELWGDVIDPWSYVAKRRLEAAVAKSGRPSEVLVIHRALPGSPTSADELERAAEEGRVEGILISVATPPAHDTTDAHRLVAQGLALGGPALQGAVLERLYAAVFIEGADIESPTVLQRLAGEAGLDEGRAAAILESQERRADVDADRATAEGLEVTQTPFVLIDQQLGLGGPATADDYLDLITRAQTSG